MDTVLQERLDRLEAAEKVRDLKYRYWRACDAKDVAGFRGCFTRTGAHVGLGAIGDLRTRTAPRARSRSWAARGWTGSTQDTTCTTGCIR